MDQHRHEHSHRYSDNDCAVLPSTATLQEETRNHRPNLKYPNTTPEASNQ